MPPTRKGQLDAHSLGLGRVSHALVSSSEPIPGSLHSPSAVVRVSVGGPVNCFEPNCDEAAPIWPSSHAVGARSTYDHSIIGVRPLQ